MIGFLDDSVIAPFRDFGFMRRALVACLALALGGGPVGTFLVLRRMTLVGDALSHAVLPGAAIGFAISGLSLLSMSIGGFVAGLVVALSAGVLARATDNREDASFTAFYLISIALGVLIVSTHGSNVDLIHVLFGSILAVDDASLLLVVSVASVTLVTLAALYRGLVIEFLDPGFMRAVRGPGGAAHLVFLALVVLNLVAGFQALGTLMAVGLMMLPAIAARFWAREIWSAALLSIALACLSGFVGLLVSYHVNVPSGPAIVLVAGGMAVLSMLFGSRNSISARFRPRRHLEA